MARIAKPRGGKSRMARRPVARRAPAPLVPLAPRRAGPRVARVARTTRETQIQAAVNLDGTGRAEIATGIGFLDHMLEQLARHGLIDLTIQAKSDLHIDFHHTTEDTAIVIGQAVARAERPRR